MSVKSLGHEIKDIAVGYLKDRGFTILCRNYKTPSGEAAIIARDKESSVFIEVKTLSSAWFGEPMEAVGASSRRG